jgi:carboxylate-amine ligase
MARTFGVEEELLLVRRDDGRPTPAGDRVVRATQDDLETGEGAFGPESVEHEFKQEQAEIGSQPCTDAADLTGQLRSLRAAAGRAAAESGAQIAAIATSPHKVGPTPTENDRYARMTDRFGLLARQQLTCGQHVHVSVDSRAEGVAVLDRIAPWLPTLLALSTNSPYWQGQDTGYASFRTVMWGLWPTTGPAGPFGDEAGYDAALDDLISTGAAMDLGMIYFDARLSARYPTVEIRVADVCTDVDDAVVIAALCRALVDTVADDWRTGRPVRSVPPQIHRAASWRAARFGLTGDLVDPTRRTGLVPAAVAVAELVERVSAALAGDGDSQLVADGVARMLQGGTGAERQRAAFRGADGDLASVVTDAARRTLR